MANKTKLLDLKFLVDSPSQSGEVGYFNFYHKYVSPALHKIIKIGKGIHTVGLFGAWGTGKSTIIENLRKEYSDFPVFIFDAWKYKDDPLRRTFLIKLLEFGNSSKKLWIKGREPTESFLDELYEGVETRKEEELAEDGEEKISKIHKIWNKIKKNPIIYIFAGSTILTITVWVFLQYKVGERSPLVSALLPLSGILGLSTIAWSVVVVTAKEVLTKVTNWILDDLRVDIKTQTITRRREYLNSPEQFEGKFKDLVGRFSKKVVIVFDNIDRVQGDVAILMLSSIKTFFDPNEGEKVIFIIPCDSEAIISQVKKYYDDGHSSFDSSEYLRKLFNVVIWTPEFIPSDLEDFTRESIKQLGKDHKLLLNQDLIFVITKAFRSNPREIKQFINNLVAALLIICKTEVWETVKESIPYFAKTLVLKQKFPSAYKKLKDQWFDPEKIYGEDKIEQELRNFMVDTNLITVANAEPFLYFKASNQSEELKNSNELVTYLVTNNIEKTKEILLLNKSKDEVISNFLCSLLEKYKTQTDLLTNLVITYINVFSDFSKLSVNVNFINRVLQTIDKDIWSNYMMLPTDNIFTILLDNLNATKKLKKSVVDRYIAALNSEELKKNIEKAIEILINLKTADLDNDQKTKIREFLQEGYSTESEVINLFENKDSQDNFISSQLIEKYLSTITLDTFKNNLPTLLKYKEFIYNNELGDNVIQTIFTVANQERTNDPQDNENKKFIYGQVDSLISEPNGVLDTTTGLTIESFVSEVITLFQGMGEMDLRGYLIPVLYKTIPQALDPQIQQLKDRISEFIKASSLEALNEMLDVSISSDSKKKFVSDFIEAFKQRAVNKGGNEILEAYSILDLSQKQEVLDRVIDQRSDYDFDFIKSLNEFPDKIQILTKLLNRIGQLGEPSQRSIFYEWITLQINKTDDVAIKNAIVAHINPLLQSDQRPYQEVGYQLLKNSNQFLSETSKREIASQLIEWLRSPGRTISVEYE